MSSFNTRSSLRFVLHTFYTGIERIFVAIARFHDGVLPDGKYWHRKLLDQMAQPQPSRPPVITDALVVQIREYFGFRHFFRNAYTFYLDWSRLQPLAENIVPTWTVLKQALNEFRKANYDTP